MDQKAAQLTFSSSKTFILEHTTVYNKYDCISLHKKALSIHLRTKSNTSLINIDTFIWTRLLYRDMNFWRMEVFSSSNFNGRS